MGMWDIPTNTNEEDTPFTDEEIEKFIQNIASQIVKYNLSVPAILIFELLKPLSFISYSTMVCLTPILDIFVNPENYQKFAAVIKNSTNIEKLLVTIENLEKEKKSHNSNNNQLSNITTNNNNNCKIDKI